MDVLPERVNNIGKEGRNFITDEIEMDERIIEALRKL